MIFLLNLFVWMVTGTMVFGSILLNLDAQKKYKDRPSRDTNLWQTLTYLFTILIICPIIFVLHAQFTNYADLPPLTMIIFFAGALLPAVILQLYKNKKGNNPRN